MSEEKKTNAQECLKLDQEELDQVAGGDAYTALLIFEQEDQWRSHQRYQSSVPLFHTPLL